MTTDTKNNLKYAVNTFRSDVDEILRIALKWDIEPGALQELGQFLGIASLKMAGALIKMACNSDKGCLDQYLSSKS
ncbi:MAG TPA: hypothetical protein PLI23_11230 [Thermoclostridium caenicola]|uniref:hypothetical protein n=1 Tax=Thermoclostridium caenicola TaxID=659425 RepID=UPI002BD73E79|nr:hypothetical protein [Thermoclostridium caenicola]HPO77726.1 hypothetical protein [Thermoclostridium caenicola]